jgi:hypothetical protein
MPWQETLQALLGVVVGAAMMAWVQKASHRREQASQRERELRDAYADWLAALDDDGCFMRVAALQKDGDEPVFSETEKSEVRRRLKLLTYKLLLLESEGGWRARIQELVDLNPYRTDDALLAFLDEVKEWRVLDDGSPGPPYGDRLECMASDLSNRFART